MPPLSIPLALLGLVASASASTPDEDRLGSRWSTIDTVIAFGDSYSFAGGTRGHPGFTFIGDELNLAFTPEELLSNEILPNITSSGGQNWLQFLTNCNAGTPLNCINSSNLSSVDISSEARKQRKLWDFAFAGANIDGNILPLHVDWVTSLVRQVEQFVTYAIPALPKRSLGHKTLVAWWIGINDVSDAARNTTITDWPAFWEAEMNSLFGAVTGGPAFREELTKQYNAALGARAIAFARALKERRHQTMIELFDAEGWFNRALEHAAELGFTNTTGNCKCNDQGYFWYDSGHPTELVHRHLADAIEAQLIGL